MLNAGITVHSAFVPLLSIDFLIFPNPNLFHVLSGVADNAVNHNRSSRCDATSEERKKTTNTTIIISCTRTKMENA